MLVRTGLDVSVCLGLVAVGAYSLPRTGKTVGGTARVSGDLMGDPFDEDSFTQSQEGPVL